jgi:5-methylcytosine-specific restriction endonuclease McrA
VKRLSLSSLEKKLDRVFSEYIRLRVADEGGTVECVTCGKLMYWKDGAQCGHFIKRSNRATRWEETNCHVQCVGCNKWRNGMEAEHSEHIIKTYGVEAYHRLNRLKRTTAKFTRSDLEQMILFYKAKLSILSREAA